jgi:hypothetical protein
MIVWTKLGRQVQYVRLVLGVIIKGLSQPKTDFGTVYIQVAILVHPSNTAFRKHEHHDSANRENSTNESDDIVVAVTSRESAT